MTLAEYIKGNAPELAITLLLIADLFLRVIPVAPLIVVILALQFIRLDIHSNIFLCLQCLPVFVGAALNTMGISGVGGLMIIIGVILLLYSYIKGETLISVNGLLSIIPLLLVLTYFFVSKSLSSGGDFADEKMVLTAKNALLTWLSFVVVFSNFKTTNTDLLGLYLILYAAFLLRLSIDANTIAGPSGLLDFAFMRVQTISTLGYIPDVYYVHYQFPGAYALQGLGLFLMRRHNNKSIPILLFSISIVIILYAGARQMIITILVVLLVWILFNYKQVGFIVSLSLLLLLPVVYTASASLSTLFESTVEEGYVEGGGRGLWLLAGVQLFMDSPVFGVGFGRYNLLGNYDTYPHNLFVELLCEVGIVGFIILLGILAGMLYLGRKSFKRYMFYFLALFMMSMASGSMYDNIIIFTLVFSAVSLLPYNSLLLVKHENRGLQACTLAQDS